MKLIRSTVISNTPPLDICVEWIDSSIPNKYKKRIYGLNGWESIDGSDVEYATEEYVDNAIKESIADSWEDKY